MNTRILHIIFLAFIALVGFFYRYNGLATNSPFWVDEFSTAKEALAILNSMPLMFISNLQNDWNNILTNILTATSFKFFGITESTARLPPVIIGSLVSIAVYLFSKNVFGTLTAINALLFVNFSHIMILWSRQARGYALQQLLIVMGFLCYSQLKKYVSIRLSVAFAVITLLGILTHSMFYIFIVAILIDIVVHFRRKILNVHAIKKLLPIIIVTLVLLLIGVTRLSTLFTKEFIIVNNVWYYHSFLWRDYGLITFLGLCGIIIALIKKPQELFVLSVYLILHIVFVSFFYPHYMTKYLLPIFPVIFICMAYFITVVTQFVIADQKRISVIGKKNLNYAIPIFVTLFIIINGDKFVTKPKSYYSINREFREIANIDYHQIYNKIKNTDKKTKYAIIETWPDRAYWYTGINNPNVYYFRWGNETGIAGNGQLKKTNFYINEMGEKEVKKNLRLISDVPDLKKAILSYSAGYLLIDDSSLPNDVIEYAEKNFKKELYLDHYPLDDNPYSIWPATLYSWGFK